MTRPDLPTTSIVSPTPNLCFANPSTVGTLNLLGTIQMSDDRELPVDCHSHSRGIIYSLIAMLALYAVVLVVLVCLP